MKPVVLEHHLIHLPEPTECGLCAKPAYWQLDDSAFCSRCYLHDVTSIGASNEFRHLTGAVHGCRVEQATDDQLNHLLAVIVLSERSIQQSLKNASARSTTPRSGTE